jgi:putative DNA primase/helicase
VTAPYSDRYRDDPARATDALFWLDANCSRAEWVRILASAKAAGVSAEDAERWSAQGESFNAKAFRDAWRSIRAQGAITSRTLFKQAREGGWPGDGAHIERLTPVRTPAPRNAAQDDPAQAAKRLDAMWRRFEAARPADAAHPYLRRKAVHPHFARQDGDDLLMGVFSSDSAAFAGLQTISPDGTKRFASGTTAKGALHLVAWPEPLDAREPSCEQQPILLAEGWATTASLYECLPWCWCVCAFNEANLPRVALALARKHSNRAMVVCGDDDRKPDGTARADGNIGRIAALQAADHIAAVTGRAFEHAYVLPVFSGAGASGDFNDMRAREGSAAVLDLVASAIREAE